MLDKKPILIAVCCAVAFVVGVYLVGRLYFDHRTPSTTPEVTNNKPGPTAKGHWHGDVWHDETKGDSHNTTPQNTFPKIHFRPLTDAERELLKRPLPPLDENGNPKPMDSLTKEEQQRARLEARVINAELYHLNAKASQLLDLKSAGGTLTEAENQWLYDVYKPRSMDLVKRLHKTPHWEKLVELPEYYR